MYTVAKGSRKAETMSTTVDLDSEESVGAVGEAGKVVPARSNRKTGESRKKPEDHPACPHCGGKMHWNAAGATINFECLWRQVCLANGTITDPNDRLPLWTSEDLETMMEFRDKRKRSRKNPLAYGKMASAGGAPVTYAEVKKAASPNDVAADAEPKKRKKSKIAEAVIPVKGPKSKRKASAQETQQAMAGKSMRDVGKKKAKKPDVESFSFEDVEIESTKPLKLGKKSKLSAATPTEPKKSSKNKTSKTAAKSGKVKVQPEPVAVEGKTKKKKAKAA